MACKPDSVRVLPPWMTIPLGCLLPGTSSCQPGSARAKTPLGLPPRDPYLALLLVGLAVPPMLPGARWAFTPPFHRDPRQARAVCFLWRFPSGFPGRALPGTIALWSPDFPRVTQGHAPPVTRGHPAIRATPELEKRSQCVKRAKAEGALPPHEFPAETHAPPGYFRQENAKLWEGPRNPLLTKGRCPTGGDAGARR